MEEEENLEREKKIRIRRWGERKKEEERLKDKKREKL